MPLTIFQLPFTRPSSRYTLPDDLKLEEPLLLGDELEMLSWLVPKGTQVLLYQGTDFDWVLLPKDTKDVNGKPIPIRIFRA